MSDNLKEQAREACETKLLATLTIKCKECKINMIHVVDLWDETIVGYSCPNCFRSFMYSVTTDSV